jgi:hypothetical protein
VHPVEENLPRSCGADAATMACIGLVANFARVLRMFQKSSRRVTALHLDVEHEMAFIHVAIGQDYTLDQSKRSKMLHLHSAHLHQALLPDGHQAAERSV